MATNTTTIKYKKLKANDHDYIITHRPASALSHWWRTLQILCFFIIFISGVTVCITVGRLSNAFGDRCILDGDIFLQSGTNLSDIKESNVIVNYIGSSTDCNFDQFSPMAGACFAGLLGVIFMQCGGINDLERTENLSRTIDSSWMIVIPTIPVILIFFIMSLIAMIDIMSGLSTFCINMIAHSDKSLNLTSCANVFSLSFPFRPLYAPPEYQPDTDLYLNYILSHIGTTVYFIGWFLALSTLLIRCSTHADFFVGTLPRKSSDSELPLKSQGSYMTIPGAGDSNDDKSFTASSSEEDTVFYDDFHDSMKMTKKVAGPKGQRNKARHAYTRIVSSSN